MTDPSQLSSYFSRNASRIMAVFETWEWLADPAAASATLKPWGVQDIPRAVANLTGLAQRGLPPELLGRVCQQLLAELPQLSDPDRALNSLERFVSAARNPLGLASLWEREPESLGTLLQIFAASHYLGELLISDPESYDLLRMTAGEAVAREVLIQEITSEVLSLPDERHVLTALRRFKRRETLRIAYGDIIRGLRLETVTRQISYLADALLEAAVLAAEQTLLRKKQTPKGTTVAPPRLAVLAFGKLGGNELNYSSDIDLMFVYEAAAGQNRLAAAAAQEYYDRLAREIVRLLTESTALGSVYRVDLRLRPGGQSGLVITSTEAALHYYDLSGRTWERQALVKARAAAGNLAVGREFLTRLEPWIYRRYLSRADITGISALKRRIEGRARRAGGEATDVKSGRGGIRDIEFVIQFLQLLNGGDLPRVRTTNTLAAIVELENAGCLTNQERVLLEENYTFLRRVEHYLQIMYDLQTHRLPAQPAELRRLALRLGYGETPAGTPQSTFMADLERVTQLNRKILDHLLHDAFVDDETSAPESDLIFDPDPSLELIHEVLSKYRFADNTAAYQNLLALAHESVRYLSQRRCRHFLAAIAPRLLAALSATADPDATLKNLTRVSDHLGGKAVLWELFSFNPPSLELYVELCASSPYLCDLLTQNPGMIDELLDSLLLDKLPTAGQLRQQLQELARGAEDVTPILHSFAKAERLRVGVRDILNKEPVERINEALCNIAEAVLSQIAQTEFDRLTAKYGEPQLASQSDGGGGGAELIVVALGKFGGRELNYHSDLDLLFLYSGDGGTFHARRSRRSGETTSNQHFFSELAQRIVKTAGTLGPHGKLYEIDARLRPTGKSGRLVTSLAEFLRYFEAGEGQLWERQALARGRIVHGSAACHDVVRQTLAAAMYAHPWRPEFAAEIYEMRMRMQEGATDLNLKRGPGGVLDVEFIVQLLQLKYGGELPQIREPNTLAALGLLREHRLLTADDCDYLTTSYQVLRTIQGRLRLMNMTALNDLPRQPAELAKLAALLGYPDSDKLLRDCQRLQRENRLRLQRVVQQAGRGA
ncbi:MAG: bifunctional [glutamate--ammonia ligase]-adenylyl-L-tyrosine phosphorylase/[glutamate--ammonia-ligase] adenylyltransferase [Pirellulales bacterium]|nr:bifunctional [glutamate--ammonia ligase]-adenylyl-L-tyrosine phosphorylase/[glutamate--ammonia-ligase] adenylyltransferase [Pirellulales bacterium]